MAKTSISDSGAVNYEAKLLQTATEYQQNCYEIWGDWNCYEENEYKYLKDFIGYGLFRAPKFEDPATMYACMGKQEPVHFAYKDDEKRIINLIFNKIYPLPVFKVRVLQMEKRKKNSKKGDPATYVEKTYYIDNSGWVYKAFSDYLAHNTLPKCTMVVPKDGMYQADPASISNQSSDAGITKVWLEARESPACKTTAKVLLGGDVITSVVAAASTGVGLAALATPIGAGVALASAVGAGVSGVWTIGRCSQELADRGLHGESINVTNKKALGAWIGIAGSMVGLAASSGTVLLARAVRTGRAVGKVATIVHDAVQIGNMVVNGVGVGLKSYDSIATILKRKTSNQSAKDAMMLTANIFFFFNSVMNIRLTQNIIEASQGQLLNIYDANLRKNRHRQEIQRIAGNGNAAVTSDVSGIGEIIRVHQKISNEDEFYKLIVENCEVARQGPKMRLSQEKSTSMRY